jgi:glycosyltransferase involved in cell wall biosynthesis
MPPVTSTPSHIVQVGDSDTGGGAAHAMVGLHDSLRRLGVDSHLLLRHGSLGDDRETIATRGDADDSSARLRDALVRQYVELNRTDATNTHFSLYIDGADASRLPVVDAAKVVHLHWTASFQTSADVRALLEVKPVVWTLHDLGPLTGGCHFPAGCEHYTDTCSHCPQLARDPFGITATTLRDKKAQWQGSRLTFIAPSRSMEAFARRSALVHDLGASAVHIPHGVDVQMFRPLAKAAARRALDIPVDGFYVLCGSHHNAEKRKGLSIVHRVMAAAGAARGADAPALTLMTVGEPKLDVPNEREYAVVQLGHAALATMPTVYAAADVFLHPSVEDNFPCMLLESSSCGTPAIAFDVGGVGEIVRDGVSGRTVPVFDEAGMAAALAALLDDPERLQRMSRDARTRAVELFGDLAWARRHVELYEELASACPAAPRARPRATGLDQVFPRWSAACLVAELDSAGERVSALAAELEAKSEHIAALQQQLREKETEVGAVHQVATERERLTERLHDDAERLRELAMTLERGVRERDDLLAGLRTTIEEQRGEIELVHRVATERKRLVEDLHRIAQERAALIERLTAQVEKVDAGARTGSLRPASSAV